MNRLLEEVRSHFNEPVLIDFHLGRIVGYAEDKYDCYMIVHMYHTEAKVWQTMVGGYYYLDMLKHQSKVISTEGEHWNDFTRLDGLLQLNGVPKAEQFEVVYNYE